MEYKTLEELFIKQYEDLENELLEEKEKNKDYEFKLMIMEQQLSSIEQELKRRNIELEYKIDESDRI